MSAATAAAAARRLMAVSYLKGGIFRGLSCSTAPSPERVRVRRAEQQVIVVRKRHLSSSASFPPSSSSDDAAACHPAVIDVSGLADSMRDRVRSYTRSLRGASPVRLVGILAQSSPDHPDAEIYSERIAEACAEDGIDYELCRVGGGGGGDGGGGDPHSEVEAAIRDANDRLDVHGILVFYPIFNKARGHLLHQKEEEEKKKGPYLNKSTGVYYRTWDDYLRDVVSPAKDVEGLSQNFNARWLFRARGRNRTVNEVYVPCTALAVLKILEAYHHRPRTTPGGPKAWSGLKMTVVNRSEILGRPLAALLALEGATVFSVDDESILVFMEGGRLRRCNDLTLEDCLEQSSVVVTGVPSPDFQLPSDCVGPGTTVVNVSEFTNVDEEALLARPNVKLIPNVGKVTVAALEQNLIQLHRSAVGGPGEK